MPRTRILASSGTRKVALALVVAGIILAFLFSRISIDELISAMSRVSVGSLLFILLMMVATNALRAYRFRLLLSAPGLSLLSMTMVVLTCNAVSNILPARLGDFAYPAMFRRYYRVPLTRGLPVLVLARILDLIAVCFIFAVAVLCTPQSFRSAYPFLSALGVMVLAVAVVLLVGLYFATRNKALVERAVLAASGWVAKRSERAARILAKLVEAVAATKTISSLPVFVLSMASSLGIWICMYLAGFSILVDLNAGVNVAVSFAAQSFTLVTIILPLNSIGHFGTFEGTWAMAFAQFGVPEASAIVSGMTLHLIQFSYQIVLGAASFVANDRLQSPRLSAPPS